MDIETETESPRGRAVHVWSLAEGRLLRSLHWEPSAEGVDHVGGTPAADWGPQGDRIAVAESGGLAYLHC